MSKIRTKTKVTYQTILDLCDQKGWETLEEKYVNANTSMRWRCKTCLYEWVANYNNNRKLKGCSRCSGGRIIHTHKSVQEIVNKKGLKLIEPYTRSDYILSWECLTCTYVFKTSFSNINREHRYNCPKCNGVTIYDIEKVKEIALEKNLTCLEDTYINSNTHMLFECNQCKRQWKTSFRSINQNIGCIKCTFKNTICLGVDFVKETIKDRNIECLETEYISTHTNMKWRCLICFKCWEATFTHIKDSNSGCPNCYAYKSQKLCRKYFEEYMKTEFPTKRPKFLQGLEYDGYSETFNLAFEYQGLQHYKYIPYFHKDEETFHKLQKNDLKKEELSKLNGVTLIKVPCKYSHKNEEEMGIFILNELIRVGNIIIIEKLI